MVSGGCHFLSCNDEKRFGEAQEGLLCVLFVSFAPEVQRRATSAGYAHLYRLAGKHEYVCNVHLSKMSPFWLK